ncbi:hypothetical protein BG004_007910 [Podila humilis]|nr:hypothetical protein BG004_007910 [Podila humilis]
MFAQQSKHFTNYTLAPSWATKDLLQKQNRHQQPPQQNQDISTQTPPQNVQQQPLEQSLLSSPSEYEATTRVDNPFKKKRPFQFEPEFYAALDSSLKEQGDLCDRHRQFRHNDEVRSQCRGRLSCPPLIRSSSPVSSEHRPVKKLKKQAYFQSGSSMPSTPTYHSSSMTPPTPRPATSISHHSNARRRPFQPSRHSASFPSDSQHSGTCRTNAQSASQQQYSSGPSIIDLSSGEELVVLHLGENEYKRRRDSIGSEYTHSADSTTTAGPLPSSSKTQQQDHGEGEQADGLDDGLFISILDPQFSATQPSPSKRIRLGRSSHSRHHHLRFLSEADSEHDQQQQVFSSTRITEQSTCCSNSVGGSNNCDSSNGCNSDQSHLKYHKQECQCRQASGGGGGGGSGGACYFTTGNLFNSVWEECDMSSSFTKHQQRLDDIDQRHGDKIQKQCEAGVEETETTDQAPGDDDMDKDNGKALTKALVPYQHQRRQEESVGKLKLVVDRAFGSLGWPQFPEITNVQGNEIVLYRTGDLTSQDQEEKKVVEEVNGESKEGGHDMDANGDNDGEAEAKEKEKEDYHYFDLDQSEFGYWEEASHPYSSVQIVELSDDEDEGNLADDEGGQRRHYSRRRSSSGSNSRHDDEGSIAELQERIMDMDLD